MNSIRDRIAIFIDKKYHTDYVNLKKSADTNIIDSPFSDFREIYILAAAIGVFSNIHKPIEGTKEKIFDSNVFNEFKDLPILYTLAFCKDGDTEALANDEYVLLMVEGYANAGFPILLGEIQNNQSSNLLNLSTYIDEIIQI
jgi:hypothetical protein